MFLSRTVHEKNSSLAWQRESWQSCCAGIQAVFYCRKIRKWLHLLLLPLNLDDSEKASPTTGMVHWQKINISFIICKPFWCIVISQIFWNSTLKQAVLPMPNTSFPAWTSVCCNLEVSVEGKSEHFAVWVASWLGSGLSEGIFQESRRGSQEKSLWSQKGILHLIFVNFLLAIKEEGEKPSLFPPLPPWGKNPLIRWGLTYCHISQFLTVRWFIKKGSFGTCWSERD